MIRTGEHTPAEIMTVGELKEFLEAHKVPNDTILDTNCSFIDGAEVYTAIQRDTGARYLIINEPTVD